MPPTVLIVDDEEDVCSLLKMVVERHGLVARVASDGYAAMESIEQSRPDLIILDLKMPRLSGYELFARLKSDEDYQKIPIVVITGVTQDSDVDDEEWARRLGAEEFLTKPFDLEELGKRVEQLVAKYLP